MTATKPRLGYIGLGLMGAPMTRRLLDAGFKVAVWNRSADKMKPLVEKGAVATTSPRGVAEAADIVMMCLTAAPAVLPTVVGTMVASAFDRPGRVLRFVSALITI